MSRKSNHTGLKAVLILLILVLLAGSILMVKLSLDLAGAPVETKPSASVIELPTASEAETVPETEPTTVPTEPEPEKIIATATISSQGDLLMHSPVFNSCKQADGTYDFESIFRYTKDTLASVDYSVANLETTFGGPNHPHVNNKSFSCPDELAADAKEAGYDMLLTANNHSGDTTGEGLIRTLEVTRAAGLETLGSQMPGEKRYSIVEIYGIRIGMVAYTWSCKATDKDFSLNGLLPIADEGQMNYFTNANPQKLYTEAEQIMADMNAEGVDATMMFIHWGNEYEIRENRIQREIAQKLCDLGFDVIVGGHAHVVQPMALLESTVDPEHKTVCIYSLGNAVSNQRTGVSDLFPAGYTEDGVIFNVSFEKYSDGNVYLSSVEVIPTWVNMHTNNGSREYNILPLKEHEIGQWDADFGLQNNQHASAKKSYERTMGILNEGLQQVQDYLNQQATQRTAYYENLAKGILPAQTETTEPPATEADAA
ncbi:MAG: CapA family protein [Oscillospiraceae bacterium]|nr:CapA family protein [Oscillospiraceae bacterium]